MTRHSETARWPPRSCSPRSSPTTVLDIARAHAPRASSWSMADIGTPGVLCAAPRTPSTTWASPARWAASSSARAQPQAGAALERGLRPRRRRGGAGRPKVPVSNNGGANAIARGRAHDHADARGARSGSCSFHNDVVAGKWRARQSDERASTSWRAGPLGIVGLGNIGKKVARARSAFDMQHPVLRHRAAHRGRGGRARRPLRRSSTELLAHVGRGEPARAARRLDARSMLGAARVRP